MESKQSKDDRDDARQAEHAAAQKQAHAEHAAAQKHAAPTPAPSELETLKAEHAALVAADAAERAAAPKLSDVETLRRENAWLHAAAAARAATPVPPAPIPFPKYLRQRNADGVVTAEVLVTSEDDAAKYPGWGS